MRQKSCLPLKLKQQREKHLNKNKVSSTFNRFALTDLVDNPRL